MADTEYTRLYIAPFNPTLLNAILPPSILPDARNISYHEVQTFPEKGYGYVDLPVMAAEKIKKKLHGSILKGTKVRIEKARPQKENVIEPDEPERPKKEKRKRKRDELPGVDIGERRVKRGWTTPGKDVGKSKEGKDKKPVIKSKYTTEPECLFKTLLPPNVASKIKTTAAEIKPDKSKSKKPGKEAIVHEFAKTTKYATFLRGSSGSKGTKVVAGFVEGKGWVDEDGNVIEEEVKKIRHAKKPENKPSKVPIEESESTETSADEDTGSPAGEKEADHIDIDGSSSDTPVEKNVMADDESPSEEEPEQADAAQKLQEPDASKQDNEGHSSSDESSSENDSSEADTELASAEVTKDITASARAPSPESTSDSSSSSESDSSSEDSSSDDEPEAREHPSPTLIRPSSSSGPSLSIKIPPASLIATPVSAVHPLEALYKPSNLDNDASTKADVPAFNFFGADDDDADEVADTVPSMQVPLTPFTVKEFEYRGVRSAAPTPDTAHANKRFVWPADKDEEEEDDDEEEAGGSSPSRRAEGDAKTGKDGAAESDFQKWFWENRGEANRSWKRRRKTVGKEKRQRENRKRQDRAV